MVKKKRDIKKERQNEGSQNKIQSGNAAYLPPLESLKTLENTVIETCYTKHIQNFIR